MVKYKLKRKKPPENWPEIGFKNALEKRLLLKLVKKIIGKDLKYWQREMRLFFNITPDQYYQLRSEFDKLRVLLKNAVSECFLKFLDDNEL